MLRKSLKIYILLDSKTVFPFSTYLLDDFSETLETSGGGRGGASCGGGGGGIVWTSGSGGRGGDNPGGGGVGSRSWGKNATVI